MESKTTSKLFTMLKVFVFAGLASAAFSTFACGGRHHHDGYYGYRYHDGYYCNSQSSFYYGNPNRPYTVWVPGQYDARGCWHEGYYLKVLGCVRCGDLVWVGDHWQVRPYRVVVIAR